MNKTKLASRVALSTPILLSLTACPDDDGRAGLGGSDTTPSIGDSTSTGSAEESEDEGDDDEPACVPGTQNDCSCPGGLEGFQVCNDAGSGFDECMCESADTTAGEDTAGDSSTGEPDPCGNDVCEADLDETCETCEADCGACLPCAEAPTCDGAEVPPVDPPNATMLNDPMAYIPPPQIVDNLAAQVAGGGMGARLIAAALSEPDADESALVGAFRSVFDQNPAATDAIRRQLANVGMDDPQTYSIERMAPTTPELVAFAAAHPTLAVAVGPVAGPQATGADGELAPDSDPAAGGSEGDPCANPRYRIRVARLDVHEEDDDVLNDEVFCAITTEGAAHAEIKVTPITQPLDEGDSVDYSLDGGLVWGQNELTAPGGNILINYNCIESDTAGAAGYSGLLMALGDAAGDVDGEAVGVDGWVFPAVGVVTNLLAGAISLDGDDLLFNASQVIGEDLMFEFIYGAWWSVRRDGTNVLSDWDWELRMEMWGCHNYGTGEGPPPPG